MTDTYPGIFADYPSGEQSRWGRRLLRLARLLLGLAGIGLVFFILQWTSAVRIEQDRPEGTLGEAAVNGKTARLQWHGPATAADVGQGSRVVVPKYAGGGRGSTLIGFDSWRFGTIDEHPAWFGLCVALLVVVGMGFAVCTWFTSHPKQPTESNPESHAE